MENIKRLIDYYENKIEELLLRKKRERIQIDNIITLNQKKLLTYKQYLKNINNNKKTSTK